MLKKINGNYYYEKTCEQCGIDFVCRPKHQRFCSHICSQKSVPRGFGVNPKAVRKNLYQCRPRGKDSANYRADRTGQNNSKMVERAVNRGELIPRDCEICNMPRYLCKINAHHVDINKPLDVAWLCPSCHKLVHLAVSELIRIAC